MITEEYVTFETAQLLKENGFDVPTTTLYNQNGDFGLCEGFTNGMKTLCNPDLTKYYRSDFISAPSQAMAMRWLREDKKRIINAWFDGYDYQSEVGKPEDEIFTLVGDEFKTYEEAVEAAIKYCLENLI